jgi:hypothetical protein
MVSTLVPVFVFAVVFARHAKAYFLAFDHFLDPPVPDIDGDSGGDRDESTVPPPAAAPAPPSRSPSDVIEPR